MVKLVVQREVINMIIIKSVVVVYLTVMKKNVVILTGDASIGASASVGISGISSGFDWDDGKVLINPSTPLTYKPSRYVDKFSVVRRETGGVGFWACPKCLMKVAKDDSYCRYCGTRLG